MDKFTNEVQTGSLRIEFSGSGDELCLERVFTRYWNKEFYHSLLRFGEDEKRILRAACEAEYQRLQRLQTSG